MLIVVSKSSLSVVMSEFVAQISVGLSECDSSVTQEAVKYHHLSTSSDRGPRFIQMLREASCFSDIKYLTVTRPTLFTYKLEGGVVR